MEGWIKLYRKILGWNLYENIPAKVLFIHYLLTANSKDGIVNGVGLKAGQLITSRAKLAKETGLSIQEIRTANSNLQINQQITIKSTKQFSIVTICKFNTYQIFKNPSNQVSNQQSTHESTTNKNNKEIYKERKKENDDVDARAREGFVQIDGLENYLLSDVHWLEAVSMRNHFTDTSPTRQYISEFVLFLKENGVSEKERGDAKRHFNFWLNKHLQIQQQQNQNQNVSGKFNAAGYGQRTSTTQRIGKRPANDYGTLHKNPNRKV